MSDLAPFVAAAIKDKTTIELLDELEKFRSIVRFSQRVEVTAGGVKGKPVFACGSLAEGKDGSNDGSYWRVDLRVLKKIPLDRLNGVQVTLGGVMLAEFVKSDQKIEGFFNEYDLMPVAAEDEEESGISKETATMYGGLDFGFGRRSSVWVNTWFGPITLDECARLNNEVYNEDVLGVLPELHAQNTTRCMMITSVEFEKRMIHGALGNLEENQGIPTNRCYDSEGE